MVVGGAGGGVTSKEEEMTGVSFGVPYGVVDGGEGVVVEAVAPPELPSVVKLSADDETPAEVSSLVLLVLVVVVSWWPATRPPRVR